MKIIKVRGPIVSNDTAAFYDWIGWDCCSPRKIEDALNDAAGDDVVLEINSQGGICVCGYEIYTTLKGYSGKVTAHVNYAASAATLIACAADEALISDAGIYMIHNAQSYAEGDYRDMDESGDSLRQFNDGFLNVYEKKTGRSREELQGLMDDNTYMGPQRAIEYGFIDGYIFSQTHDQEQDFVQTVVAAETPVVPEHIAKEIMAMCKNKTAAPVQQEMAGMPVREAQEAKMQETAAGKLQEKEGEIMTLEEFANQGKEARAELETMKQEMREKGAAGEHERMKALDGLEGVVSREDIREAKYGEHPMDAPSLAYHAAMKNRKAAEVYMENALKDAKNSGAADVGIGETDAGETETNEDDEMAAFVNKKRGGNRDGVAE